MSRLVDATICPDCRSALDTEARCSGCGLQLTGAAASELWQTLQHADALIGQLRTASLPGDEPAALPKAPGPTSARPAHRPRGLPSLSVPLVLLGLGATCLLVAAVVFVAVAWSSLGLTAKTAILLAVTALFGVLAVLLTRRALRGASETFWLIVLAMVSLDVLAAKAADLPGLENLAARHVVGIAAAAVLILSIGIRFWSTTTPVGRLVGPVVTAGVATVTLTAAEGWASPDHAVATAISLPVTVLVAVALLRAEPAALGSTARAVGAVTALSCVNLVFTGLDRAALVGPERWWPDLSGWPLLAAAGYAAAVATSPRAIAGRPTALPDWIRMCAAAGTLVPLTMFAIGPSRDADLILVLAAGAAVVLAAVSATAPRIWGIPAGLLTLLSLLVSGATLLIRPLTVVLPLPWHAPRRGANLDLRLVAPDTDLSAWTAVVVAVAVLACLGGLIRHLGDPGLRTSARHGWIALVPAILGLGGATVALENEPTLLVASTVWGGALAISVGAAVAVRRTAGALGAVALLVGYLVAVGLRLTLPSHVLMALLASVICVVAAAAYARADVDLLHGMLLPVLGALVVGAGWVAAAGWPYPLGGADDAAGLAMALVAAVGGLAAQPLARTPVSRVVVEASALVLGLGSALVPTDQAYIAMTLTIIGTAVALVSLLNSDRDQASWLGVAVLGAATAYRVGEDFAVPELYVLPAAALLLAAGVRRMLADTGTSSARALASGLTLALTPSLLLALDEPVSWRGLLIGVAGLLVLAIGVARGWAAPFVAGAVVVAILALRHLGPVAEALPRWISLGTVGLALLLVGVTWEARRRNLETASRYLAALR